VANKIHDYNGFYENLKEWENQGLPYGFRDLIRLAVRYNCEIPTIKDGKLIFKTI